jgi:hypothetical protein
MPRTCRVFASDPEPELGAASTSVLESGLETVVKLPAQNAELEALVQELHTKAFQSTRYVSVRGTKVKDHVCSRAAHALLSLAAQVEQLAGQVEGLTQGEVGSR